MKATSIGWLALCTAAVVSVAGCAYMRQGESTSRCSDCATALYRDTGSGGSIYSLAAAGEQAVGRVATRYCKEHGLGQPAIGDRYASALGRDFWQYDFSCAAQETAVVQPATAPATQGTVPQPPPGASNPVTAASPQADSAEASAASVEQSRRQQQREQAVRVMRLALAALPAEAATGCTLPVTMTIRLACGEVVSCTKRGDEVHCD